jgi:hypothetical protein
VRGSVAPKPPSPPQRRRAHLAHVRWLPAVPTASQALDGGPATTRQRLAEEARAWTVARMTPRPGPQRYPFAVALLRVRTAQVLEDWGEMCLRRLPPRPRQAQEALAAYRDQPQEQPDALVARRGPMVSGWQARAPPAQQRQAVDARSGGRPEPILAPCEAHVE